MTAPAPAPLLAPLPRSGPAGVPVVVVGAGPVGQTTALLLARWGVPVLLLDARPARDLVGSKALCQQRDVLDVWDTVGVGSRLAEEGVTWTTSRTYYRDAELFAVRFSDRGRSPLPPFVNVSQSRTEQLLDERIAAEPLVELRWGALVTGVRQGPDGVVLSVRQDGRAEEVRAAYAVLCAGTRSQLRDDLGLTWQGRSFADRFLICDIRADLPGWESERRFFFDPAWNPGRQVLIHACPDSVYRIDWQVPPDYDLEQDRADGGLERRIRAIVGDSAYEVVWASVYRFSSRCVDRMRVGRVLLAGDVAHVVAPFGARGLNSGVQDAENAAWKLAFVLRGWAPEALLDSYDQERLAAARENLDVTGATMRFLVPQDDEERARRLEALERALHDPDPRRLVDSGRLAEPYWYTASPLTTPDPSRPGTGRPPAGQAPPAAPGVLLPDVPVLLDGAAVRLRALARRGLLLLRAAGAHPAAADAVRQAHPVVPLTDVDLPTADPDGAAAEALGVAPGEVWLVRPDAHVAAVVPAPTGKALPAALFAAVDRVLAAPRPPRPVPHPTQEDPDALLPVGR